MGYLKCQKGKIKKTFAYKLLKGLQKKKIHIKRLSVVIRIFRNWYQNISECEREREIKENWIYH